MSEVTGWYAPFVIASSCPHRVGDRIPGGTCSVTGERVEQPFVVLCSSSAEAFVECYRERRHREPTPQTLKQMIGAYFYEVSTD